MITHVRRRRLEPDALLEATREELLATYKQELAAMEQRCRDEVEQL